MREWKNILLGFFLSIIVVVAFSEPTESSAEVPEQGMWAFSGLVSNEDGNDYTYFFQMQKHNDAFHSVVALFDAETKDVVFFDESQANISSSKSIHWRVGHAFLRFNEINKTWIFGLKTEDKHGFNFKVDTLDHGKHASNVQTLRDGIEYIINQTGSVSGHIQTQSTQEEQFVTAKHAWFRQVWISHEQDKSYQLSGLLCSFNDGSGLYSMNMLDKEALRGSIAGWFTEEGVASEISQFIHTQQSVDGLWHIQIAVPKLDLVLNDFIKRDTVIAGFVTKKSGFCTLSEDIL